MTSLPRWAAGLLACPRAGVPLVERDERLETTDGRCAATIVGGIVRVPIPDDAGIAFYRAVGGPHFHERADVPYAMSALDTPVYHAHLASIRPTDPDALIVDVGGGDGRNALPWLDWGGRRVVVVDAVGAGLERLRERLARERPEWLDRVLLIEADARAVPLADGCAARVQAIEALYYLNDAYELGLRECVRLMGADARLLVSERDYEGGLLTRLLYGGVRGMLEQVNTRDVWDGNPAAKVRSRCFTAAELTSMLTRNGLRVIADRGIPALSLVLGYLRTRDGLEAGDDDRRQAVIDLLCRLGETGALRRCHVLVAERRP